MIKTNMLFMGRKDGGLGMQLKVIGMIISLLLITMPLYLS